MHDGILCCDCNNTLDKIKNAVIKYTNKQIKIIVSRYNRETHWSANYEFITAENGFNLLNKLYNLI